jgi:hypothetical protein
MTDHGRSHPDPSGESRRPPDGFDDIVAQPDLADLADLARRVARPDRMPLVATAAAFCVSLFVSHLLFGPAGDVLVVVVVCLPLLLASILLHDGAVDAGRSVLRAVIGVLVGWAVLAVLLVPPPSLETPSRPRPAAVPPSAQQPRGVTAVPPLIAP